MPATTFGPGYDATFLGRPAPAPLPGRWADDLAVVDGSTTLDYTHFSLALSTSRRLCRWAAWNIDGATLPADDDDSIGRAGLEFRPDPRVPASEQTLDDVYAGNPLDRGHIARRRDLTWGPRPEAEQANYDSFYFTNICPQMDTFNQSMRHGLWGLLENAVLAEVRLEGERLGVLGGPVLRDDDPAYRTTQVPREYWKVVLYVMGGDLRARSFLLTQKLGDLDSASPLDAFRTYEVSLEMLAGRTGLEFAAELEVAQTMTDRGARTAPRPRMLGGLGDITW